MMFDNQSSLGLFLIAALIGFTILIYFLLKSREAFLKKNLLMTADQAWKTISERAEKLSFSQSEMLFSIFQDASATSVCLVVKDARDQIVGQISSPMATRRRTISIANETYTIEFPLSWNRTSILRSAIGGNIIAKYKQTSWFGQHEFEVTGHGVLRSERVGLSSKNVYHYRIGERLIGTIQEISSTRKIGRLVILPLNLPLEVRMFVLAV